jgi:hypothetical protein
MTTIFISYVDLKIPIEVKEDSTIGDLSEKLKEILNVEVKKQKIFFKNKILDFDKTLKEENIQEKDVITLKIQEPVEELDLLLQKTVSDLNQSFQTGKSKSIQFRLKQLNNLKKMIEENEKEFKEALDKDLKVPEIIMLNEIIISSVNEINDAIANLASWMEPTKVSLPLAQQPGFFFLKVLKLRRIWSHSPCIFRII